MSDTGLAIEQHGAAAVIRFKDASILDSLSIQRIGARLQAVLEEPGVSGIVLDFTDVRFLGSEALRALLTLRNRADKANARIALCCIRPELIRIFSLTNLDQMFRIYPQREAALEYVQNR